MSNDAGAPIGSAKRRVFDRIVKTRGRHLIVKRRAIGAHVLEELVAVVVVGPLVVNDGADSTSQALQGAAGARVRTWTNRGNLLRGSVD